MSCFDLLLVRVLGRGVRGCLFPFLRDVVEGGLDIANFVNGEDDGGRQGRVKRSA